MKKKNAWPGGFVSWVENRTIYVSIPFTWELPKVRRFFKNRNMFWDNAVVGGPAVALMPDYFNDMDFVTTGKQYPGVLQMVNRLATKTSTGCVNKCGFCCVPKIEGKLKELDDWPNLPIICDNNLLACSTNHFDKVIDRLIGLGEANFNQGLDARRLTDYHAIRIAEIKRPLVYLALDNIAYKDSWDCAYDRLRSAGLPKSCIRSYALIGFNSDPKESWDRCMYIDGMGVVVLPQWYHALNQLEKNIVTDKQKEFGWNDYERRKIMQWFYQHKKAVRRP